MVNWSATFVAVAVVAAVAVAAVGLLLNDPSLAGQYCGGCLLSAAVVAFAVGVPVYKV